MIECREVGGCVQETGGFRPPRRAREDKVSGTHRHWHDGTLLIATLAFSPCIILLVEWKNWVAAPMRRFPSFFLVTTPVAVHPSRSSWSESIWHNPPPPDDRKQTCSCSDFADALVLEGFGQRGAFANLEEVILKNHRGPRNERRERLPRGVRFFHSGW